jgi:hypothetical protein
MNLTPDRGTAADPPAYFLQTGRIGFRLWTAEDLPHNGGSGRVLEKLGFGYTHDEFMPQTGLNHPCYLLRPADAPPEVT